MLHLQKRIKKKNFIKTTSNSFNLSKNNENNSENKKIEFSNFLMKNEKMDILNKFLTNKDINYNKSIMNLNDYELNTLQYKDAIEKDKRVYSQYYISLLKTNHLIFFTFVQKNDYNSKIIKIFLFLFTFILSYVVNALFFGESVLHQIYKDAGKFNFIYQIPQIIYSSLISNVINIIIKTLSLSEKNILEIKNEKILIIYKKNQMKSKKI